jgi:hypothetical protein
MCPRNAGKGRNVPETAVSNRHHNAPMKFGRILAALAILGIVGLSLAACKTGTPPAARPFYTPGG